MTSIQPDPPLPLSFRADEVGWVMDCLSAGESCALVGAASTGKSNLFRFLAREDVQAHYLGDDAATYLFALVDSHSLAEGGPSTWNIYELALHRILQQAEQLGVAEDVVQRADDLYQRLVVSPDALLGQRYLERVLTELCGRLGDRVVLLFDEFDEIWRNFDRQFFLNLRHLRDEFKYRVMYVVGTRDHPARLRDDLAAVEAFYELLSLNVRGVPPYNPADARVMVRRQAGRRQLELTDREVDRLVALTGGHSGLLRAAVWAVAESAVRSGEDDLDAWLRYPGLWEESAKLWDSLGADELDLLAALAADAPLAELPTDTLRLLDLKGLLSPASEADGVGWFSPLWRAFVDQHRLSRGRRLWIDPERMVVHVNGRSIANLTKLEFALLLVLDEHRNHLCERDDIIQHLYSSDQIWQKQGIQDNRLDTIIGRLRAKIEPDRSHPRYLITVRGRGFMLQD